MSVETVLRAKFLADPSVSALVGDRISSAPAQHVPVTPFITYQMIGATEGNDMDGVPDISPAQIQYNCVSADWISARQVLETLRTSALRMEMRGMTDNIMILSIFVANKRDMGIDVDTGLYRHDLDLEVWLQIQ